MPARPPSSCGSPPGSTSRVTVNGADARSLLAIMALGVRSGERVEIAAGDGGRGAVDAIADLLERGA